MSKRKPPSVENAPGIVWKPRVKGWEARWQARTDLIRRGYLPRTVQVWVGAEEDLDEANVAYIQHRAQAYQDEMLIWSRGGLLNVGPYDGTLKTLAGAYQTDPDSTYKKLRFRTREFYDVLLSRIVKDHGSVEVADIKARQVIRWHEDWSGNGKVAMSHALVGMLRTIIRFGATMMEDRECERVSGVLSNMRFSMAKPRSEHLSAEQAIAIRKKAHELGLHSMALAQAIQFDCMLRQKDVIGEWVPITEPGITDVTAGNDKWLRGIRWEEIDDNLILHHITSKRQKLVEPDLRLAPMVMEELTLLGGRPSKGPVIVSDRNGVPWTAQEFRRKWREVADLCGVPKNVRNMDSRAGAISEATDAGAELEHIRHAATHGDIQMTQRYSRGSAEKTANVMRIRAEHRAKNKE